jgi:hypothetical protein
MDRKLIYTFGLDGFFLIWGVFGFAAAAPRNEPDLQKTVQSLEETLVIPGPTESAGIPVTAKPEPVLTEVLLFYGLIGLSALFLIMVLLNVANKSTAPYVQHEAPPSDETRKN